MKETYEIKLLLSFDKEEVDPEALVEVLAARAQDHHASLVVHSTDIEESEAPK